MENPHPLHKFDRLDCGCYGWDDEDYRRLARAGYFGLVLEIRHHVGRPLSSLEEEGPSHVTIAASKLDYCEYVGDHWLWFKRFSFDEAHRAPVLIFDPSPEADATRGQVQNALVESVDILRPWLTSPAGRFRAGFRIVG